MRCPSCQATQLVEIFVTVRDRQLTMRSCSHCELRWWDSDGENVVLDEVLDMATDRR
jgi:transcription elongation factor Elf1